jgi:Ner family transcriptional regulator
MSGAEQSTSAARSARKGGGWSNQFIVYRLHERGTSLRKLDAANGYSPNTLQSALRRPWPKAERIIAAAIGVRPETIWPSRYNATKSRRLKPREPR